jgi:hypothetical protein
MRRADVGAVGGEEERLGQRLALPVGAHRLEGLVGGEEHHAVHAGRPRRLDHVHGPHHVGLHHLVGVVVPTSMRFRAAAWTITSTPSAARVRRSRSRTSPTKKRSDDRRRTPSASPPAGARSGSRCRPGRGQVVTRLLRVGLGAGERGLRRGDLRLQGGDRRGGRRFAGHCGGNLRGELVDGVGHDLEISTKGLKGGVRRCERTQEGDELNEPERHTSFPRGTSRPRC